MDSWQTSIRWLVADGARVERGDRVAELDNTSVTATLEQKRTDLQAAEHELAETRARNEADLQEKSFSVERTRADMEKARLNTLVPATVISAKEVRDRALAFERAKNEAGKAQTTLAASRRGSEAEIRNLELQVDLLRRDLMTAQHSIDTMVLTAPERGIVLVNDSPFEPRKLQVGERVWVGLQIARLPDMSSIEVVASLPDVDDGAVRVGDTAFVVIDAYPDRRYTGRVVFVAPVAQEIARGALRRAFRVVVHVDDLDSRLMHPGYSVQVTINRVVRRNALLVPRTELDFTGPHPTTRGKDVVLGPCNSTVCVQEESR